ncbi:MAG: hypothetical protein LUI06_00180 [Ruminococcus sp.]|nr:hypothetical protein [Ruminococcus sp.]
MNVFKIIFHDFKSYKFYSLLILVNVIVSAFVISFSYGIYQNYNIILDEGESAQREIYIYSTSSNDEGESSVTTKMLLDTLMDLSEDTLDNIQNISCQALVPTSAIGKNLFEFDFTYDGKKFYDISTSSSCFTEEEYNSFEKIVAINPVIRTEKANNLGIAIAGYEDECWDAVNIGDSETIDVNGESYKIVNESYVGGILYSPITAFYNDTPIRYRKNGWVVSLYFTIDISRTQYDDLCASVEANIGENGYLPELDITPTTELFYYRTIMIVSVFISILAALNFAILYRYILQKRIRALTIFRISGCSKGRIIRLYLSECLIIGLPFFALTELVFSKLALPALSNVFEYIESGYSMIIYLAIFGIYAVSSFVILLIMISAYIGRHSIKDLMSGGAK